MRQFQNVRCKEKQQVEGHSSRSETATLFGLLLDIDLHIHMEIEGVEQGQQRRCWKRRGQKDKLRNWTEGGGGGTKAHFAMELWI